MARACAVCGGGGFAFLAADGDYEWEVCADCGFVRVRADFSVEDATGHEGEAAASMYVADYERKFASKMRRTRRRAARMWRRRPGDRFLDVGSNYGFMVEAAARLGFAATGVEINPILVEIARKRFPGRDFREGALERQQLGDGRFDCVYCSEVIEHTADPRAFVRSIARVMAPGGLLYLTTPHIREYRKRSYRGMGAPGHKMYFTGANLERLLREAGFARVRHEFTFLRGIKVWAERA